MDYIQPFFPQIETPSTPKINYTISLHRAVYTKEVHDLYQKYEAAVHNREPQKNESPDGILRHLCNSPVYDPEHEQETVGAKAAPDSYTELDKLHGREYKDKGVIPECQGTYFMHHRLDGKLVAVGCLDIL